MKVTSAAGFEAISVHLRLIVVAVHQEHRNHIMRAIRWNERRNILRRQRCDPSEVWRDLFALRCALPQT
jgi:hypothetical protein